MNKIFIGEFNATALFKRNISYPELPTIDADVVTHLVFETLGKGDRSAALRDLADRLLKDDWLIENPEWSNPEEESEIKWHIFQSITTLGNGLYQEMKEIGLFPHGTEAYNYQRMLNDSAIIFSRVS